MEIKVSKIKETRLYNGTKSYDELDITNEVVMPIIDIGRLDETLDTSSITLINTDSEPITPFTRIIIRLKDDFDTENLYRLVMNDTVSIYTYGSTPKYKHELQLVEITKWLERFEVDNTTITNFLAFLYSNDDVVDPTGLPATYMKTENQSYVGFYPANIFSTTTNQIGNGVFYNSYIENGNLNTNVLFDCSVTYGYWYSHPLLTTSIFGSRTVNCNLTNYTIKTPSGNIVSLLNIETYNLSQIGVYTITQEYETGLINNGAAPSGSLTQFNYKITLKWNINVLETPQNLPTKYTLSQVVDVVLNKVGNEATVIRDNIDEQMFMLDPLIREKFNNIIAPEFTFTQDTLFGVLSKIGEVAHAIPRLIPNPVVEGDTIDDYSDWNIITFDFLGGNEYGFAPETLVNKGSFMDSDDYATNYVSNIQNSFQTNDAEYVCLTEPYEGGWISPRTEASDFVVSNDEAVIKTSRPIQRIVSLKCKYFTGENTYNIIDISRFVLEITDYNLKQDYGDTDGIGNKQGYIYYTRGSNIIGGLTYRKPEWLSLLQPWNKRAIEEILSLASGTNISGINIKDLNFQIKYVPYYDLKIKQYKPYINDNSGNNELFYNQINEQMVDIESLGNSMQGALLRVANEEPNYTAYCKNLYQCAKPGELDSGNDENYYVFQTNREINEKRIKETVQLSKDYNKWNAYLAIKKNYREWEISEKESLETNPVYCEFCIISDKPEFYTLAGRKVDGEYNYVYETEVEMSDGEALTAIINLGITYTAEEILLVNKWGDDKYTLFKTDWYGAILNVTKREIFVDENGVLQIDENYVFLEEALKYYNNLETEKGVLNTKFFDQLYNRFSNTTTNFDYHKISWVVGTTYTQEWQGGEEYKQVKKSFLLPCACFSVGNSIVFDFGAIDNYSMGTTVYEGQGYGTNALEKAVEYGDKYGRVDALELQYGFDDAIIGGFDTETQAKETSKKLYEIDLSKLNRKNVLIDYKRDDNSQIVLTKTCDVHFNVGVLTYNSEDYYYYIENRIIHIVDSYGNQDVVEAEIIGNYITYSIDFGYTSFVLIETGTTDTNTGTVIVRPSNDASNISVPGIAVIITINDNGEKYIPGKLSDNVLIDSVYYTITELDDSNQTLTLNDGTNDFYSYKTTKGMFRINKDSRQSLQFTNQLNFVTDNKKIWIGSALAKTMPFVGETTSEIGGSGLYRFVAFNQKPSKFSTYINDDTYTVIYDTRFPTRRCGLSMCISKYRNESLNSIKGVGILDNKNRLVFYYDSDIKPGEYTPDIYLRLRRKL